MLAAAALAAAQASLEQKLRAFVEAQALMTGFSIQLAYRSSKETFSVSAGLMPHGAVRPTDRFLFGSGTKPYTAASVFKLIDVGQISIDSPAYETVDIGLRKLGSTDTMESLFGSKAKHVTVGMLLQMKSGIADFDIPSFDNGLLQNASTVHSPLEFLDAIAQNSSASFVCEPGSCTCYSSTNYILAGLVLLGVSDASSWEELQQSNVFPAKSKFPNSSFVTTGPISDAATVPGRSQAFSPSQVNIWDQDASILGWTCGNLVAPAQEVAHFFYALLVEVRP